MKRRGKSVALWTAAVGIVVLVTTAFVGRQWIVEEFYIRRLASSEEKTRLAAAEALGEMRSVRAVPHLIRLVAFHEGNEDVWAWESEGVSMWTMTPIAHALYRIGPKAVPLLRAELHKALAFDRLIQAIETPSLPVEKVASNAHRSSPLQEAQFRKRLQAAASRRSAE